MLRGIPKILPPNLVKYMMEMGHSDYLVLADANFPGTTHAKRIIRMDSALITDILQAILPLFPLDTFVSYPVKLMRNLEAEPLPKIWETFRLIIRENDQDSAFSDFAYFDRLDFYKLAEGAYTIVQTGDAVRYGNIILQKGVY
jgi:L-fucose mutarotase